ISAGLSWLSSNAGAFVPNSADVQFAEYRGKTKVAPWGTAQSSPGTLFNRAATTDLRVSQAKTPTLDVVLGAVQRRYPRSLDKGRNETGRVFVHLPQRFQQLFGAHDAA
ncbi:MAG: hypothetical protein QGI09_07265, partial [Dehalococcoidia bacterium]|nr:hypothetical protein [Dehalococcoidia bacterium]